MNFITEIMDKIDSLSIRERAAIFIAILAVIFFTWDSYLMASLDNRERIINAQLQQKQAEQSALNTELQELISKIRQDPNARERERLEKLRQQLEKVKSEVLSSTEHLIAPNRMARVLESVLDRTEGLDLVEVRGLGSSALVTDGAAGSNQSATEQRPARQTPGKPEAEEGQAADLAGAYKHGLKIVFTGSFMSTLQYVKDLEELNSEFIWDNLQLKVLNYPDAEASITVFTLSLDKNWIGV